MSPYIKYILVEQLMYSHFLACFVKCFCKLSKSQVLNQSVAKKLSKFFKIIHYNLYATLWEIKDSFSPTWSWPKVKFCKCKIEIRGQKWDDLLYKLQKFMTKIEREWYRICRKILRIFQTSENFHLKLEFWNLRPKSSSGNTTELKR